MHSTECHLLVSFCNAPKPNFLPFSTLLSRPVSAAEGSGHSSGEELAGDLSQCGDHDGGLILESVPGFGQEKGGPNYHRLRD